MNPILLYFLSLVIVFGGFYLIVAREVRKAGGLKSWLIDLPTTNFRIFISIILAIVYVISTQLLTILHAMNAEVGPPPDAVLDTLGLFIFGMMGLDVASYLGKRMTHKPGGGDDAPPGATGTMRTEVRMDPPGTVQVTQIPAGQ